MLPGRMLLISIAQQADVGFSRRSTDVIQLALTLKMTTAQVVETSVTFNNNYVHPDDQTQPTFEMTPGFKPFTKSILFAYYIKELSIHVHCTWLAGSMNEWAGRWLRGERLVHYQRIISGFALLIRIYPEVSLSMKMCTRRKAGRSVPFPWSLAVHHQSLASTCEKRCAWGGSWSGGIICEIVNSLGQGNVTLSAKIQGILKTSCCGNHVNTIAFCTDKSLGYTEKQHYS